MSDIQLLWIDDDSPERVEDFEGVKIVTAQSCAKAEELLTSRKVMPNWALVDLILPQGSWGEPARMLPGLHYIDHLKKSYGDKIGILAYSIAMTPEMRKKAIQAGAVEAYGKTSLSLGDVVQNVIDWSQARAKSEGVS
jgi:ActR/RegA family two-component response regulator